MHPPRLEIAGAGDVISAQDEIGARVNQIGKPYWREEFRTSGRELLA
jgi:hypothetical protein